MEIRTQVFTRYVVRLENRATDLRASIRTELAQRGIHTPEDFAAYVARMLRDTR